MKLGQDCERVAIRVYQTCQYGGRKSGGRDAEFQEKIRKEWACLHCGGSSWVSDFSARLVFKGGRPDSENSKLVKAPTVPKAKSRNPRHAAGAHWHRVGFSVQKNCSLCSATQHISWGQLCDLWSSLKAFFLNLCVQIYPRQSGKDTQMADLTWCSRLKFCTRTGFKCSWMRISVVHCVWSDHFYVDSKSISKSSKCLNSSNFQCNKNLRKERKAQKWVSQKQESICWSADMGWR